VRLPIALDDRLQWRQGLKAQRVGTRLHDIIHKEAHIPIRGKDHPLARPVQPGKELAVARNDLRAVIVRPHEWPL